MAESPHVPALRRTLLALLIFVCAGAAACDRIPGFAATADAPVAEEEAVEAPENETIEAPPSEPLPERIYFTLTDYAWYARGEPLVYENSSYSTGSGVVAAPASAMRKVGEYQGVDVYTAEGAVADSAVYVPVFPGYWQPFHLAETAAAAASGS